MNSEVDIKDEVFIGARALKEQINLVLPTYSLLLEQIEQIRSESGKESSARKENNNTIGIFGSRGTGKTSALYTVMEKLESEGHINIVLPIIEPDNFGENTKIMGSIIGLLSDAVNIELEKIKKLEPNKKTEVSEFFNNCIYKENNPLKVKRDELIEYHLYTESEYRNLLTHNFEDTATHIKKSSYLLTPDIKFKDKLTELIDALINTRNKINKNDEKKPLIFIFIDDIDLKTIRCKELIDSILQYANHPNVVTVLSGDYEILNESITLALISDENLHLSKITPKFRINPETTIFERKKYLANEYLKKILPPARRHNVVNWNIRTIPNFAFGEKTLAFQLNELFSSDNLFGFTDNDKLVPIKYSYSIFDKTPRGLVNVYYHIYQINQSKNVKDNKEFLFKNAKSLIDTIVVSSTDLVAEQKRFFEECLLWGDSEASTFIDFKRMIQFQEFEKKDGIGQKRNYAVHKNSFNFFIICELLKQLLPDTEYNESDYTNYKNLIFHTIFYDPKDKKVGTEIDSNGNIINNGNRSIKIYNSLLEIANNSNTRSALLLLEYLASGSFGEDYAYKEFNDESKYEKDRNIFISICKLVKHASNDTLMKELYLKSYDNRHEFLVFDYLNDICSTSQVFSITEKTFSLLIKKVFKDSSESGAKRQTIEMLFINTLIKIQTFENEFIEEKLSWHSRESVIYKQTLAIRNTIEKIKILEKTNEKRSIERLKNNVNRIIDRLASHINVLLGEQQKEFGLAVNDQKRFNDAYDSFKRGTDGSSNTVYSDVKGKVWSNLQNTLLYESSECFISKEDYNAIFSAVKSLSNNYRVWYGRQDAYKFLEVLKQEFYIDLNLFDEIVPILYELGLYFKINDEESKKDVEFEDYKKFMKNKLEEAFKAAKDEVELDLKEIGSNLYEGEQENK